MSEIISNRFSKRFDGLLSCIKPILVDSYKIGSVVSLHPSSPLHFLLIFIVYLAKFPLFLILSNLHSTSLSSFLLLSSWPSSSPLAILSFVPSLFPFHFFDSVIPLPFIFTQFFFILYFCFHLFLFFLQFSFISFLVLARNKLFLLCSVHFF